MKHINTSFFVFALAFVGCNAIEQTAEAPFSIHYEKFTLDNGLEVILHEDHSDPIVAVATVMHVGSNREKVGRTGFAHFFEHMSFNDSENTPLGANRKLIPEWGGVRNGGTWNDGTIYYEVVPKDAFDKILWVDSDRFGYMIKTVTKEALEREKQVVKNEKRERVDNAPYGFTNEVIIKNLYPEGHPYSWTVIGELSDLQSATLDDVKEFYEQYYGAGNASLVIAGDIDIAQTKTKVQQWFGEIRKGPVVEKLKPMPVELNESKVLYFEDNFAKLPELRMVFPTVENYHEDEYALNVLGQLLTGSKKSPVYKVLVKEKEYAPSVSSGQNGRELAGEFVIRIRANEGIDLDSVKLALTHSLELFEKDGFDDNELLRIKASLETGLYRGIETVLDKAYTLVNDNEFAGDPSFITKRASLTSAVTAQDVKRVYEKYLKAKPYIMTSFVPKGQLDLVVEGSIKAEVYQEEIIANVLDEEVGQGEEADYEKTPSIQDRSEPDFGELPFFKMPIIWTTQLPQNSISVYGIENNELPLVAFNITIKGGHYLDPIEKSGAAALLADLMMEGTAKRTSAALEEAIDLLGASINISSGNEEISIDATCLAKNFEPTVALIEEMILEPRWDEVEYNRLKQALETRLKGNESNPTTIAYSNLTKLMYGADHILGVASRGTHETIKNIELADLKNYYANNFSASMATLHVVGLVDQQRVVNAFEGLDRNWKIKDVTWPNYEKNFNQNGNNVYFIDVPGSKQSVIFVGKLALSAADSDYNNLAFANEILGGGSSGKLFQILRIEKGYTYGAYSFLQQNIAISPFVAYSSVRANATKSSIEIITDLLQNYGVNFSEEEVKITQNKIVKGNTLTYESLYAKRDILSNLSKYGKSMTYIEEDQRELMGMTLGNFKEIIERYLPENEMFYVVVGDKKTQLKELNSLGKGAVIEMDINGNLIY